MGVNWENDMVLEMKALKRAVDYLQERGVNVCAVLLPQASWCKQTPFPSVYRDHVSNLCRESCITLIDLNDLLEDEEFADHSHPNFQGAKKCHAALVDVGLAFLRKTGALGALPK